MQIILDKGQREDWLSSNFIRVFFRTDDFGIIAGILWELREKEPVVDLRMLKGPPIFAIATTAMVFPWDYVLYSSTVLIPQLLQQFVGIHGATGGNGRCRQASSDHVHDARWWEFWSQGWTPGS